MASISVGGLARFYDDEGSGPPVVLVHGSASSSRQWRKLSERLCGECRVLAADLCATDGSGEGVAAFTFAADCALVARLLEIGGEGAHLVGHSYGGVIAARVALDRPRALASLTLIEPSCFHLLEEVAAAEHAEIAAVCARQLGAFAAGEHENSMRGFIDYWMGEGAWLAMPERRRETIVATLPKFPHDWSGTNDPHTRLADYRTFTVPTLLIRAHDTVPPSARIVEMLGATLPHCQTVTVSQGGHMSPLTNPDEVNAAIAAFIGRQRAK
jgi:pimeloyl-ACP methyl ester carboxylesterase